MGESVAELLNGCVAVAWFSDAVEGAGGQAGVHKTTELLGRNVSGQEADSEGGCQHLASNGRCHCVP